MIIWHVGGGGGGYGKAQELAERYAATFCLFEANIDREETTFPTAQVNLLMGASVQRVPFHIYERASCSSVFKINPAHASEVTGDPLLKTWGEHRVMETRELWTATIDSLARIRGPDILSLDAQGCEFDILLGARKTLGSIVGILAEFQTTDVYEGQGLFHDQCRLMHANGFRLADITYKEYWERDGTKLLTAGDALFLNFGDLPPEKIEIRNQIAQFFGLRKETSDEDVHARIM